MTLQYVFPFDDSYALINLVKQLMRANIGAKVVYFGFEGRRVIFERLTRYKIGMCSETFNSLKERMTQESSIKISREVTFMSSVISPNKIEHVHIYQRRATKAKDKNKQLYRCIDPDCSKIVQRQDLLGKRAKCPKCFSEFIIYQSQLTLLNKDLVCMRCSKKKGAKNLHAAADLMEDILFGNDEKESA